MWHPHKPHVRLEPRRWRIPAGRCLYCGHRAEQNQKQTRAYPPWMWYGEIRDRRLARAALYRLEAIAQVTGAAYLLCARLSVSRIGMLTARG